VAVEGVVLARMADEFEIEGKRRKQVATLSSTVKAVV